MSFGFSIGDIISCLQISIQAYKSWKGAVGKYSEITASLDSLVVLTGRLLDEAKNPQSVIFRQKNDSRDLCSLLRSTSDTVSELQSIVVRYKGLGSSRSRNWERLKFGNKDMQPLQQNLTLHLSGLSVYLETIGLSSLGRIEDKVDALSEMKAVIDGIASDIRAGKRQESVMTIVEDDDIEVWRQFRRDLVGEGFLSSDIERFSSALKEHLKQLRRKGLLDEEEPVFNLPNKDPEVIIEQTSTVPHVCREQMDEEAKNVSQPIENFRTHGQTPHRAAYATSVSKDEEIHTPIVTLDAEAETSPTANSSKPTDKPKIVVEDGALLWLPKTTLIRRTMWRSDERYFPDISKSIMAEIKRSQAVLRLIISLQSTTIQILLFFDWKMVKSLSQDLAKVSSQMNTWYYKGCLTITQTLDLAKIFAQYPQDLSEILIQLYNSLVRGTVRIIFDSLNSMNSRHSTVRGILSQTKVFSELRPTMEEGPYRTEEGIDLTSWDQNPSDSRRRSPRPGPRRLTFEDLPIEEFFPIRGEPVLPNGWYPLIGKNNKVFFVDAYALFKGSPEHRAGEKFLYNEPGLKTCFPNPPVMGREPGLAVPQAWNRVETYFGRVFWQHKITREISYDHPERSMSSILNDGSKDEFLACQISIKAWNQGCRGAEFGFGSFNRSITFDHWILLSFNICS